MNKLILALLVFGIYSTIYGQQGDGGTPKGFNYLMKSGIEVPNYTFSQPDIEKLRKEDQVNDSLKLGPWRFGYNYSTNLDLYNAGVWSTAPNGDKVWLMKISSEEAKTINLTFSNTFIPEGNELYIYNPEKTFVLGKFTQNHIYKGELGAELIPGDEVVVEYYVPAQNTDNIGSVQVATVTHGYRTVKEYQEKAFKSSGSCNMNVNCPAGTPYLNQRNSVVMIVSGSSGFCSGALINNTQFDATPYVLTAHHCGTGVTSWIFRFNWQSESCDNPSSSPSFQSLSGAVLRANRAASDFLLVEITGGLSNGMIPVSYQPYFSGWDNGGAVPSFTFGIHHPSGDIKKISFDDNPAVALQLPGTSEPNNVWRVSWDRNTTTESGSSGSPLFNQKGQIIGQLWKGDAGCNNPGGVDFYGRLRNSWNPVGSTVSGQLMHWLDPESEGTTSIIGYDPYASSFAYNASIISIDGVQENNCSSGFNPSVVVLNKGTVTLTSLTINYSYNGSAQQSYNWSGNLPQHQTTMIQLPWIVNENGTNTIDVSLTQPNGQTDEDFSDNDKSISYQAMNDGLVADFKFYLGCYVEEVAWKLKDDNGNVLYSGGNYAPNANIDNLIEKEFCLSKGCYELILSDTDGDGVEGDIYSSCDYTGRMTLTQRADNQELAILLEDDADFGSSITYNFCVNNVSLPIHELEYNISIYPNPSKGVFNIIMDFKGEKEIVLMNMTGQIIERYKVVGNQLKIDRPELESGVYVLSISNEKNRITRKLIVE